MSDWKDVTIPEKTIKKLDITEDLTEGQTFSVTLGGVTESKNVPTGKKAKVRVEVIAEIEDA